MTDNIRETAALWFDRMRRDVASVQTRDAFGAWREESVEHCRAYEAVEHAWREAQRHASHPKIIALRHEAALRLTRRTSLRAAMPRWAVAAAIVMAIVVTGYAVTQRTALTRLVQSNGNQPGSKAQVESTTYRTRKGERLAVTLKDGSQVTLNTQTELETAFTRTERHVILHRGQALFEVAKNPDRPFVVEAQSRRLVAVGTAFDVRLEEAGVQVTMVEGTVRVEHIPKKAARELAATERPASPKVTMLTAGQQLMTDSGDKDEVRNTNADHVTSWQRGQVIFENARLADAIAEFNRYSDNELELDNPSLQELRLSGAFATGRPAVFIEALTTYFPIKIVSSDDHVVVLGHR